MVTSHWEGLRDSMGYLYNSTEIEHEYLFSGSEDLRVRAKFDALFQKPQLATSLYAFFGGACPASKASALGILASAES